MKGYIPFLLFFPDWRHLQKLSILKLKTFVAESKIGLFGNTFWERNGETVASRRDHNMFYWVRKIKRFV